MLIAIPPPLHGNNGSLYMHDYSQWRQKWQWGIPWGIQVPEGIGDSGIRPASVGSYHESQACAAGGAPVTGQAARVDAVPLPTDDGRMARRANRVLRPRKVHVPHVDVREPFPGDAVRRGEPVRRRRRGGGAVLREVARDVERDLPVRLRDEVDHLPDLIVRVVVSRVQERGELDVGRLRGRPDRRKDRVEIPPQIFR